MGLIVGSTILSGRHSINMTYNLQAIDGRRGHLSLLVSSIGRRGRTLHVLEVGHSNQFVNRRRVEVHSRYSNNYRTLFLAAKGFMQVAVRRLFGFGLLYREFGTLFRFLVQCFIRGRQRGSIITVIRHIGRIRVLRSGSRVLASRHYFFLFLRL